MEIYIVFVDVLYICGTYRIGDDMVRKISVPWMYRDGDGWLGIELLPRTWWDVGMDDGSLRCCRSPDGVGVWRRVEVLPLQIAWGSWRLEEQGIVWEQVPGKHDRGMQELETTPPERMGGPPQAGELCCPRCRLATEEQ